VRRSGAAAASAKRFAVRCHSVWNRRRLSSNGVTSDCSRVAIARCRVSPNATPTVKSVPSARSIWAVTAMLPS
jgi:hypothetical protein